MNAVTGSRTGSLWRQKFPECQYVIMSEHLYPLEMGEYNTYGIQVIMPEYTDVLHDVSVCKKTAERIVEALNHYRVSPVHMQDVVIDMLP